MAQTRPNADQIKAPFTFDDTQAAGATLETGVTTFDDYASSISSALKLLGGTTNWYDGPSSRDLATTDTDLATLEAKTFLFRSQVTTSVSVTAAQNWEVLSVSGSEAPSETAAVGAVTTEGAVVAQHDGTFGTTHSLAEVTGGTALGPKNLVLIVDATTGDELLSSGRTIYGLMQSESATDGHTFDDTTSQVQISFVRQNAAGTDLEACPVADIASQSIRYSYVRRLTLENLGEQAFLSDAFVDDPAATSTVTFENVLDNQSTTAAVPDTSINLQLDDGIAFDYEDKNGASLITITGAAGTSNSNVTLGTNLDHFTSNAVLNDFVTGLDVGGSGKKIEIGKTDNTITSTSANDLTITSAASLILEDSFRASSTWATTLTLADSAAEWSSLETAAGGENSLVKMLTDALNSSGNPSRTTALTNTGISADVNVTGAGGSPNLDAQLGDYSSSTFVDDVLIFLNGVLQRPGADATANHDVYPGDTPANGDLKFEFALLNGDQISMIIF